MPAASLVVVITARSPPAARLSWSRLPPPCCVLAIISAGVTRTGNARFGISTACRALSRSVDDVLVMGVRYSDEVARWRPANFTWLVPSLRCETYGPSLCRARLLGCRLAASRRSSNVFTRPTCHRVCHDCPLSVLSIGKHNTRASVPCGGVRYRSVCYGPIWGVLQPRLTAPPGAVCSVSRLGGWAAGLSWCSLLNWLHYIMVIGRSQGGLQSFFRFFLGPTRAGPAWLSEPQ